MSSTKNNKKQPPVVTDLEVLKQIGLIGKKVSDTLEGERENLNKALKAAFTSGEIPFEIKLDFSVSIKVLKPKSA